MPELIAIGRSRLEWVNADIVKRVKAVQYADCEEPDNMLLEVSYLDGSSEEFTGDKARELWISLGISDWITDGDGNPKGFKTPFGDRNLI